MDPIRVLVAEDEQSLRSAIEALVTSDDGLVLVGGAKDAEEAIRLASEQRPDVAIVDVKMPRGGGPRAAREIRERSPTTKVVALSAYDDRAAVLEMVRAGAMGYLVKGAPVADILDAIHGAVRGHGALSGAVAGDVLDELALQLEHTQAETELRQRQTQRIERALREDVLTVVFQPIVHLDTDAIVGFEALARFNAQPTRPPDVWFAEAAAVGLRLDLELAAVRAALAHLARIPPGLWLSVNVSPETLITPALHRMLEGTGAPVVVEVTEHTRVEDYAALAGGLDAVRALGGLIAVDDAGAGFASLRHILDLGPDIIKLDVGLTRGIDADRSRRALARALIAFAAEIGATLIAEGIETPQEMETLVSLGVSYGQGYFLARPGPLGEQTRLHHGGARSA